VLFGIESIGLFQQLAKGSLDQGLAVGRRHIEDAHVFRVRPLAMKAPQHIVGAAKNETREQFLRCMTQVFIPSENETLLFASGRLTYRAV
jgi:hypothetical protein